MSFPCLPIHCISKSLPKKDVPYFSKLRGYFKIVPNSLGSSLKCTNESGRSSSIFLMKVSSTMKVDGSKKKVEGGNETCWTLTDCNKVLENKDLPNLRIVLFRVRSNGIIIERFYKTSRRLSSEQTSVQWKNVIKSYDRTLSKVIGTMVNQQTEKDARENSLRMVRGIVPRLLF